MSMPMPNHSTKSGASATFGQAVEHHDEGIEHFGRRYGHVRAKIPIIMPIVPPRKEAGDGLDQGDRTVIEDRAPAQSQVMNWS